MTEIVGLKDRFYEVMPDNKREIERQDEGWLLIMDRATGLGMIVHANTRENALWMLRALNFVDKTQDKMSEEI